MGGWVEREEEGPERKREGASEFRTRRERRDEDTRKIPSV